MPATDSRSVRPAAATPRAEPKCSSSARLRFPPMPGISSSGERAVSAGRLGRARDVRRALGAVSPDSEAVGLVAQALQVVEHGIARLQAEGCLAGPKDPLA